MNSDALLKRKLVEIEMDWSKITSHTVASYGLQILSGKPRSTECIVGLLNVTI